jgi:hypothetical protein
MSFVDDLFFYSFINETPTTDEIDLMERIQEEVINKTPTTDEIDLVERE